MSPPDTVPRNQAESFRGLAAPPTSHDSETQSVKGGEYTYKRSEPHRMYVIKTLQLRDLQVAREDGEQLAERTGSQNLAMALRIFAPIPVLNPLDEPS